MGYVGPVTNKIVCMYDKRPWSLEACLSLSLTISNSLGATNMLQFLIDINLNPHAEFHKNPIEKLREGAISNLTLATSVFSPPPFVATLGLLYSCLFNNLSFLGVSFKMSHYRRKTAQN